MGKCLHTFIVLLLVIEGLAFKPQPQNLETTGGYLLPKTVRPTFYNLTLNLIDFGTTEAYTAGEVEITLDVDSSNIENIIQLNSNLDFPSGTKATWQNGEKTFSCDVEVPDSQYIEIHCGESIIGKDQKVTLMFTPLISTDSRGIYLGRYNEEGKEKFAVSTLFESAFARRVFPCFDEPEFKAPIRLTLVTNEQTGYVAVANTKVDYSLKVDDFLVTTFEPTPNMSTYLLAFVISQDFQHFEAPSPPADIEFSVFARKSAEGYLNTALTNFPLLLEKMNDFTEIPYAQLGNPKMTLAPLPEFGSGAMENWGLITFGEGALIDEAEATARRDIQTITEVIAHEFAHQWFGDYVTLIWWSELWLNEGFAEYFEYYLTEQIITDSEMLRQLIVKEQQPAFKTDVTSDAIPLCGDASDVTTEEDFDRQGIVAYGKGASVIKMLKHGVGEEVFRKGLQTYLNEHKWSNGRSSDIIDALQSALPSDSNLDLETVMYSWIYEVGFPILEISLDTASSTVSMQSRRFPSFNDDAPWWIPVSYTTSEHADFTANQSTIKWTSPEELLEINIQIPENSWIIFNLQAAGFYRVNYDDILWERIIAALKASYTTIDVLSRSQLIDDAFNIAKYAEAHSSEALSRAWDLAEYLRNETEYHPWFSFFIEIEYLLYNTWDATTLDPIRDTVKDIISQQVAISLEDTTKEDLRHSQVLKNNLLLTWACNLGLENCVDWAREQFEGYKADPSNVDNDYRDIILCTGLANSDNSSEDFNFLEDKLQSSVLPLEEWDLTKALACRTDADEQSWFNTLDKYSAKMLHPNMVNSWINDSSNKLVQTLKFALDNYSDIHKTKETKGVLKTIAAKCFLVECLNLINDYLKVHQNNSNLTAEVSKARKTVEDNLEWVKKHGDVVAKVMQSRQKANQ